MRGWLFADDRGMFQLVGRLIASRYEPRIRHLSEKLKLWGTRCEHAAHQRSVVAWLGEHRTEDTGVVRGETFTGGDGLVDILGEKCICGVD